MMKYVSPICEMVKLETEDIMDIMETSLGIANVLFSGAIGAVDTANTTTKTNADGSQDISVGIDFNNLSGTTNN